MIELRRKKLAMSFPEVHAKATLSLDFQRTLRIPDDGRDYPLPPGLGSFPIRHVDDYAARLPELWKKHGGVMLPMYQSDSPQLRRQRNQHLGSLECHSSLDPRGLRV
jgi:hypothetical protein